MVHLPLINKKKSIINVKKNTHHFSSVVLTIV